MEAETMLLQKVRLGLRKPRFFVGIITSILIVSSFSTLAPSVRADTNGTPIDVTAPTSCQSLLAGSYTNPQSGIGQIAADGRGAAVCSWSLSNLSGAEHIRLSFEMNSSVPTPGPFGSRVTAFLGFATSAPVHIDPDLSAIFPNSTKTTTTTVDCCFLPAFLAFESDLWTNPDAPLSGDRIQKICQQQYPGYADDNIFHSYSIDMDIASQTTTWTADGGTASASCSGFTLLPTQVVFYARSSDDGNSMVAQIRNINVSTGAQQPDFSVTVSPASQEIPLTGDGTYNIQIVPHNNFDTDVTLAVRFSQVGLGCSFEGLPQLSCNDATTTISPGHSATLFISPQSPLQSASTYSLTVYATPCASNPPCSPDSSSVSQGVSFTTTKLTGIRNVITMTDFLVKDSGGIGAIGQCEARMLFITTSCFTIQQNFFVSLPGFPSNTGPYWAQNVLAIGRPLIPYPNNVVVWSGWELWNSTTTPYTLIGPFKLFEISGHSAVSTPTTFTLTSYINGDKLYMYSDYHSFVITLKSPGGYISRLGLGVFQPQLDIVGAPGGAQVTFGPPTDGSVQSFVQLESGPWSPLVTQTLLNCLSPCNGGTATGETSLALGWTQGGSSTSFAYKEGVNVEGVGFTPATGVGSAFLEGGSASVGDLALG